MSARKQILQAVNRLIAPTGAQLYRAGVDMEYALGWLAARDHGIAGILDLGAAQGNWSRMALDLFPGARVIGVDPLEERRPALDRLRAENPRFDYVLAVAGEEDGGSARLSVTEDLDGSSVDGCEGAMRTVPVRSLDAIVAEKRLRAPYFLKFDTHGFEAPILRGASMTLADTRFLVMEAYNFRHTPETLLFHEMIALMAERGFRVTHLVDVLNRPADGTLWQVDLMFAREDDPVFASNAFRHG
ncbi:FkbM family methyltransferase [Erythrobacter sp. HL-111]|uniref:FkbM family methyltransferase n=1 Tax=Erythrobacter sp. HL-111 TaxID=1798193 RepID=UPI0006DAF0FA|nr:FkbM family methyltransferase [Erythrobacter sp. HL-111]KPP95480.1 MAG: methyltransferase, FkbM family [Erythrobacteraceae bacterium HL-111]SDS72568.1 methyltransferase, FkbM family [Erythrobacter sp. HL-111]